MSRCGTRQVQAEEKQMKVARSSRLPEEKAPPARPQGNDLATSLRCQADDLQAASCAAPRLLGTLALDRNGPQSPPAAARSRRAEESQVAVKSKDDQASVSDEELPDEGIRRFVRKGTLDMPSRRLGVSPPVEQPGVKRENGFDGQGECIAFISSPNVACEFPEARAAPSEPCPAPLPVALAPPANKSSFLSKREQGKHARLCEEAEWVLIDQDGADFSGFVAREKRTIRPDGFKRKLLPRCLMQQMQQIPELSTDSLVPAEGLAQTSEGEVLGLEGKEGRVLRCKSFDLLAEDADMTWFSPLPSGSPALQSRSLFQCACTTVSTSDEWRQSVQVV